MSGNTNELVGVSKEDLEQIEKEVNKHFPNYELKLEEQYSNDVLKGHRLILTHYIEHKDTGHRIDIARNIVKIPKHCPKWITKHNLWDYTAPELKMLQKLLDVKKEKSPSKNTLAEWKELVARDRKKANVYQTLNSKKHKSETAKQSAP